MGLANPVHFGTSAGALVTIDTVNGPVVFGLEGANVNTPTLNKGVITYADVFPGVDLEFRTEGGRLGKHLVLANENAKSEFRFTITDPEHSLGDPVEGENESWAFPAAVAFGTGIELPAPAAWAKANTSGGLPGSAHQSVAVTAQGYAIDLSVDPLWAETASYPLVLDPAVHWTDEIWTDGDGLVVGFAPTGATDCDGGPCNLAGPVDGFLTIGEGYVEGFGSGSFLAYVGTDLGALAGREVSSAVLGGYDYYAAPMVDSVCSTIDTTSTGVDLAAAQCGAPSDMMIGWHSETPYWWSTDVTDEVRAVVEGTGPTGLVAGFAVDRDEGHPDYGINRIVPPELRLVYDGYPVPRPLTLGQTFGCACWAGTSSTNQALAADPVNTATGGLIEHFPDVSVAGVGQSIDLHRTYNSLDTASGPLGPGWSFAYGASLIENGAGEFVFTDGSGTQTQFGALVGGGYAPIDPAVSATLSDGPGGTLVMRNLAGYTMTFDADGALLAAADERGQGVTVGYADGALATVTDALGQTLTFAWDTGTGDDARIVSATTSDGRTVGYSYTDTAGAKRLTAVTAVDGETTTFEYAPTGGISRIIDPLGFISARNTYNAAGRITSQRDEMGARTTFKWHAPTQTATITDPTGKVRKDIYIDRNLVMQIDGNGAVIEQLYDGNNNKAAVVDASGQLYRSKYDDRDRLIRRIAPSPLNYTESWTYDDDDRVTSYTDAEGHTTTYTYNGAGLATSVGHPDGGTSTYTYTTGAGVAPENLLATSTDPLERTTTYAYSAAGDLISTTSPGGKVTTSTYDAQHRVTSTTSPSGAVTSYTYDAAGRLLTVTDPSGATTTNTYDAGGRLIESTDALGRPTRYKYDRADRVTRVRDAAGNFTYTSYDGAGRVETTTDALGAVTTYTYDDAGRLTETTDALERTTTTAYDVLGHVTSVTDPAGGVTTYTYDVLGQVTSVTDPDGVTQTTTYDQRGNVASVTDAAGGYQVTSYDAMNRPVFVFDSDGVQVSYTYDLAGQLIEEIKPRSTETFIPGYWDDRTTYTYDADGNRASAVDPRGNVPGANPAEFTTTVTYDADGRPIASTDPLGRTVTTEYDPNGRPLTVTDPAGNTTTNTYNANGWLMAVHAPAVGKTKYRYDKVGNLTRRIDALNRETTYTHDALGRVLTQTDPLGRVTAMAYDEVGNLAELVKPSGTATPGDPTDGIATYVYDVANRLTETTFSDDTVGFTYDYSPAGRVLTAERVQGSTVLASSAYAYDDAGRIESTVRTGPGGGEANYAYTSAGRLSGAAWSTGISASYNYNQVGQLTSVTPSGAGSVPAVEYAYDPAGQVTTTTRQGSSVPITTAVEYDAAGQVTSLTHSAGSSVLTAFDVTRDLRGYPTRVATTTGASTSLALYVYDAAGRLRNECYVATGDACTGKSPRNVYTYDKVGNRLTELARTVVGNTATSVLTDYTYDDADQLLTQSVGGTPVVSNTWTPNGALASTTTDTGTQVFTTDLSDELVSVVLEDDSTVAYTHDARGNRTSRSIDTVTDVSWAWDELSALPVRIGEYNQAGVLDTAWLPDVTSPTGTPLAQSAGGVSSWLLSDVFANVSGAVTVNGSTLTGTRTLAAFGGELKPSTGSLATSPMSFSGQYLDSVTGLYDMRARDYDPATGRFTAMDPVPVPTGMPYFASYVYGYGNPLMYTDPTGMWAPKICWGPFGNDCPTVGQSIANEPLTAGMIDGAADTVVEIGSSVTPSGIAANWNAYAEAVKQRGVFSGTGYALVGAPADALDAGLRDSVGCMTSPLCISQPANQYRAGYVTGQGTAIVGVTAITGGAGFSMRAVGATSATSQCLAPAAALTTRPTLLTRLKGVGDDRGSIGIPGGASRLTNAQAADMAARVGYTRTNYISQKQTVFSNGNTYIVQDITGHTGGLWKMGKTVNSLKSKKTRMGTYDYDLNYIGP